MILNNNDYMNFAQPRAYLRRSGLAGIGNAAAQQEMFADWNMDGVSRAMTALNSQTVFLMNLNRQNEGLPPLDVRTASPAVNFGMTPETRNVLLGIGILGAIAFALR